MTRRFWLRTGVFLAAGVGVIAWQRNSITRWLLTRRQNDGVQLTAAGEQSSELCVLTPDQAEGPYFAQSPVRGDIREDRKGIHLDLELEIVKAADCTPVENAVVEIWHCDASGEYSGYDADFTRTPFDTMLAVIRAGGPKTTLPTDTNARFLRGSQTTDSNGRVRFQTIFPGWYDPRVPHIHIKVSNEATAYLTTQLYFRETLSNEVFANHPEYSPYGACPYNVDNDIVLGGEPDARGLLIDPEMKDEKLSASMRFALGV